MSDAIPTRLKLLIVDDSTFVRRLMQARFEDEGFAVATAEDGATGVRLAFSEPFDVVVVDGVLPVMSGPEVCRRLSTLPRDQKPIVILHTGAMRDHDARVEAFKSGADAFLVKHSGGDNLIAMVQDMMGKRAVPLHGAA